MYIICVFWHTWLIYAIIFFVVRFFKYVCMYCMCVQYSFQVIPKVGELIAGDAESYQYLVESIRRFPKQVCHTHTHCYGKSLADELTVCPFVVQESYLRNTYIHEYTFPGGVISYDG